MQTNDDVLEPMINYSEASIFDWKYIFDKSIIK